MKKQIILLSMLLLTIACKKVKNKILHNVDRVAVAYEEKETILQKLFLQKKVNWNDFELFFRVLKQEGRLEVWAKNRTDNDFTFIKKYSFCTGSGTLGPKRKEGDYQIPEGFYTINRYNPKSSFYLSLGLNYPNASDLILSDKTQPGSDIFIHGACVSVGCVSITDDKIKEVYLLANEAKKQGQKTIEVHCFPFEMTKNAIQKALKTNPKFKQHQDFWQNLKIGYDLFEQEKQLFNIEVDPNGAYLF